MTSHQRDSLTGGVRVSLRGRLGSLLRGCWPALAYVPALAAASTALVVAPPDRRSSWLAWASTNLENLSDHPVRAVVVSAVLVEGDIAAWVVLAAVGLVGLGRATGSWAAAAVAVAAHLLGTAVSEGSLAVRIARDLAPDSDRAIVDVGPSFVVVGTLVATVVAGRGPWWRLAAVLGFALLVPSLFDGLTQWDVAAVGHLTSIVVGLAAGALLLLRARRPRPATPA